MRSAQEHIVRAAEPLWQQGRGHPLIAAIARSSSRARWQVADAAPLFGNAFYAKSPTHDPRELIRFKEIEADWIREGRRSLPSYFSAFGVISAHQHVRDLNEAAKAEARKKGAHRPTRAETTAIAVLRGVLQDFAPKIAQFYEEKRTSYTIAATDVLLGEFKRGRGYHSHEIFLAERIFESDFAEALAVFLHEHAHIHGYDGSRTFTDALTDASWRRPSENGYRWTSTNDIGKQRRKRSSRSAKRRRPRGRTTNFRNSRPTIAKNYSLSFGPYREQWFPLHCGNSVAGGKKSDALHMHGTGYGICQPATTRIRYLDAWLISCWVRPLRRESGH